MNIKANDLREMNACSVAIEWVERQETTNLYELFDLVKQDNRLSWANWYIVRILNTEQKARYAIFAAESVLCIYEEERPDDRRPRRAIEAAKSYLNNHQGAATPGYDAFFTTASADTASDAANDAYAAAYYATYATYAAAAGDNAYAATYAAYAAEDAYAAVDKECMIHVIEYGLSLLVD